MPEASEMGLERGPDGRLRCWWCLGAPELLDYHDRQWGRPLHGERGLFEMLTLESFQSGLSWLTILRKRDGFRRAFEDWDPERIAAYDERDVDRLLGDASIVRNRAKVEATIANAGRPSPCIARVRRSTSSCGASHPAWGRRALPRQAATSRPGRRSRPRWRRSSSAADFASSARRRPTRSWRRPASSTTTWRGARSGHLRTEPAAKAS